MFKCEVKTARLRDDIDVEWSTIIVSPVAANGILDICFDELFGSISMFRSVNSAINAELGIYEEEILVL